MVTHETLSRIEAFGKLVGEVLAVPQIEDFEDKNDTLVPAAPVEIIRHLMDSNGLRQVDMVDVFGTPSIASEVLNGKRDLAKRHIEKLSHRFDVSPALFFAPRTTAAA